MSQDDCRMMMIFEANADANNNKNNDSEFDNSSMDLIASCKEFYVKRVRRLDSFREKLECLRASTESVDAPLPKTTDEDNDSVHSISKTSNRVLPLFPPSQPNGLSSGLIQLKTDMMALMEHDIMLTSKLISLSEAIAEFKRESLAAHSCLTYPPSTGSSMVSLNDDFNGNVNRVTVDDDYDDDDEEEEEEEEMEDDDVQDESIQLPRRDYFARQSSILRIPIPPSRHRSRSYVECPSSDVVHEFSVNNVTPNRNNNNNNNNNEVLVDKREHILFKRQSLPIFGLNRTTGNNSSRSVLHSPASDSGVSMESTNCSARTDENDVVTTPTVKIMMVSHESQNSFDSGIHLVSPSDDKIRVNI